MTDPAERMRALEARFVASASGHAAAMRDAQLAGDNARLAEIAHHLAGASGIFGQPELGDRARELEEAIDAGASGDERARLVGQVLAALDRLA